MKVKQFVMAYGAEQDRLRALLPEGFSSLRPVLRINAEIREGKGTYLELNTPVEHDGRRGWLNIANWQDVAFSENGPAVTFSLPALTITYTGTGRQGGCPAEKDNEGCFYPDRWQPAEIITSNKEYCDCRFAWHFSPESAAGESTGVTLPAFFEEPKNHYPKQVLSAENAAAIPCIQVLGSYRVEFCRE